MRNLGQPLIDIIHMYAYTDGMDYIEKIKGRGTAENPPNRFEPVWKSRDPEWTEEDPAPGTLFLKDTSRSILSYNDSPDLGFNVSFNPYRGCEHGCVYCYARPTHEYLGLSSGLDFETRILVKMDASQLLRKELGSSHWQPQVIMLSGNTDCYQPVERRLQITRKCLEVLAECRNPVGVISKNQLVARDIDLFQELARHHAVSVTLSVTTLKDDLAGTLEPRTSRPAARIAAIRDLAKAGIPVGVNIAPVIPGLNDYEIPDILKVCREAGAIRAGFTLIRLPHAVKDLFEAWLIRHVPESKEKILHRIREIRGGKLYDSRFGARMRGEGLYARQIERLFRVARYKAGYPERGPELRIDSFRPPKGPQMDLFEDSGTSPVPSGYSPRRRKVV
jgi:DNA repair photolyase